MGLPIVDYLNSLGLVEIEKTKFLAQTTKPCPKCSTGKLTIARFKPHSAYFVCTGQRLNSLGVPVPDVGCGHVEYRIVAVIPEALRVPLFCNLASCQLS